MPKTEMTLTSRAKQCIEKGGLCLGLGIRLARTAEMGRILNTCDYDYAFIDLEHSTMDVDTATQMGIACQDAGVTPLARVPQDDIRTAARLLDGGMMGIIFPHVDSASQAKPLVNACKYPPMGKRSAAGPMAQLGYRAFEQSQAQELMNKTLMTVLMIETPTGVENANEIAAIEGVDVLLIGSNDLCTEMGIPGQFNDQRLKDAMAEVIAACKAHHKVPGFGGVYDEVVSKRFVGMGMRFILAGGDTGMFMRAASARAQFLRGLV